MKGKKSLFLALILTVLMSVLSVNAFAVEGPNDVVIKKGGTYTQEFKGHVTINTTEPVTIVDSTINGSVVIPESLSTFDIIIENTTIDTTVSKFNSIYFVEGREVYTGSLTIRNSKFIMGGSYGVSQAKFNSLSITGCTFEGSGSGTGIQYGVNSNFMPSSFDISGNTFKNLSNGVVATYFDYNKEVSFADMIPQSNNYQSCSNKSMIFAYLVPTEVSENRTLEFVSDGNKGELSIGQSSIKNAAGGTLTRVDVNIVSSEPTTPGEETPEKPKGNSEPTEAEKRTMAAHNKALNDTIDMIAKLSSLEGDAVLEIDAMYMDYISWQIVDRVAGKNLTLKIKYGNETHLINCVNVKMTEANRIYYRIPDFLKLYGAK